MIVDPGVDAALGHCGAVLAVTGEAGEEEVGMQRGGDPVGQGAHLGFRCREAMDIDDRDRHPRLRPGIGLDDLLLEPLTDVGHRGLAPGDIGLRVRPDAAGIELMVVSVAMRGPNAKASTMSARAASRIATVLVLFGRFMNLAARRVGARIAADRQSPKAPWIIGLYGWSILKDAHRRPSARLGTSKYSCRQHALLVRRGSQLTYS